MRLRTKPTILVAVTTTLMTLLVGLVVAALMVSSLRVAQQERAVTQATALAQLYSQQAADVAGGDKPTAIDDDVLSSVSGARVWYVGLSFYPKGERILDAPSNLDIDPASVKSPVHVDWTEEGDDLTGGAAPVTLNEEVLGTIIVAMPKSSMPLVKPLIASLVLAVVLALVVGLVGAAWFARKITKPLINLSEATHDVSMGKRGLVLPDYTGHDEVRDLRDSFQRMVDDLELARQRDDHFFASVSHELRTPLAVISGQLSLVQEGIASPEERLPEVRRQAAKMERLIGDLVDIARLRQGRFDLVQENLRFDEWGPFVAESWSELLPDSVELSCDWGPVDQPEIFVDPERLEQVCTNLVRNAGRYARSHVRVSVNAHSEGVDLLFEDDGPDIERPNVDSGEEIFESFVSDRKPGSVGIGLTISRELARAMGGELYWVPLAQRGPNALDGASFVLALPASGQ